MRKAFLASKALGLKLLRTLDLDGALILHPDDRTDARSVWPAFDKLGARIVRNKAEVDAALRAFKPDIVFVCGWYWLIPDEVRALAAKGFFGIHNSLLPKYRGGAPLVWQIINGVSEVGSTLFRLEGGIDDGMIVHQVRIDLPRTAHAAEAAALIEDAWEREFPAIWRGLCDGSHPLLAQEGEPTYVPNRKPQDGLIDWRWPAARIHDFIRAQSAPYPGAFSGDTVFAHSSEQPDGGTPVKGGDGATIYVTQRKAVKARKEADQAA